jgi:hypothetical protein
MRGCKEKLLRGGVQKDQTEERPESSLPAGGFLDDKKMTEGMMSGRDLGSFHRAKGGAATSPGKPLCTDANPMEIGEAAQQGRVEWKKGVSGVGEGVVTMRDMW